MQKYNCCLSGRRGLVLLPWAILLAHEGLVSATVKRMLPQVVLTTYAAIWAFYHSSFDGLTCTSFPFLKFNIMSLVVSRAFWAARSLPCGNYETKASVSTGRLSLGMTMMAMSLFCWTSHNGGSSSPIKIKTGRYPIIVEYRELCIYISEGALCLDIFYAI